MKSKSWTRLDLSHYWLALAVISLFASGFFALFISAAKIPGLAPFLKQIDFFRRALVIHVDLSVVVWFMCVPVALFHFLYQSTVVRHWMRVCFGLGMAGVILFAFAGFLSPGRPLLSNYIPVTTHPLYIAGLLIFMVAVGLNYLSAFAKPTDAIYQKLQVSRDMVQGLQFGVRLGSLYFLLGFVVLFIAVRDLPMSYQDESFYEVGVWGFGHLQQFSNLLFMVVSWILLLTSWSERPLVTRPQMFIVFSFLSLPLLMTPFLMGYSPTESTYRDGFTQLMRWGSFPPTLLLLGFIFQGVYSSRRFLKFCDFRFITFVSSAALLVIGFIFGAYVRGPDLRLPGHYHATIGAVTVALMGAAFLITDAIRGAPSAKQPLRVWSAILYSVGQFGFSGGMFIAGVFGMARKTYGVEQHLENMGQRIGLMTMGGGGVLALAGGFVFAVACLPRIFRPTKVRAVR